MAPTAPVGVVFISPRRHCPVPLLPCFASCSLPRTSSLRVLPFVSLPPSFPPPLRPPFPHPPWVGPLSCLVWPVAAAMRTPLPGAALPPGGQCFPDLHRWRRRRCRSHPSRRPPPCRASVRGHPPRRLTGTRVARRCPVPCLPCGLYRAPAPFPTCCGCGWASRP